jgi:MFS family permease
VCLVIALAGSALLLTGRSAAVATIGVFLLGIGFAAMFPTVLGFIGDRYANLSGTAFSLAFSMALVGGMTLPFVAGILGGMYGMRSSFVLVPAALVVLSLLLGILSRGLGAPRAPRDPPYPPDRFPRAQ